MVRRCDGRIERAGGTFYTPAPAASALLVRAHVRLDEFFASACHELRTPLTAILGWARILRTRPVDCETSGRALEAIERNALAEAHVIQDLLDGSLLVSGRLRLDRRPLDPVAIVRNAIGAARPLLVSRHISVATALDAPRGPVLGDPDRLSRVVLNMVAHAARVSPPGAEIHVRLLGDTGAVRVRVRDAAPGPRPSGGISIALAEKIAELHGGSLRMLEAAEGPTQELSLPLAEADAGTAAGPGAAA